MPLLKESKQTGGEMELANLTVKDLREVRPDLVDAIVKESENGKNQAAKDEQFNALLKENKGLKDANAKK
ncbi:MAG: hypothetical protein PHO00_02015, partial [bacterium]|nr:hypothetical protein [bacterium]